MVFVGLLVGVRHEEVHVFAGSFGAGVGEFGGVVGEEGHYFLEVLGEEFAEGVVEAAEVEVQAVGAEAQRGVDLGGFAHVLELLEVVVQEVYEDVADYSLLGCV